MAIFPDWLPDGIKVLGGLILLYPALRVSYLARQHYAFDQVEIDKFPSPRLQAYVESRKTKIFMKQFEWNLRDQIILFCGLGMVIAGDVLNLIERVVSPTTH